MLDIYTLIFLAVAVFIVLRLCSVLSQSASTDGERSPLPPLESFDGDRQFRLFVAGASASGKTVFLASLYKSLTVPGRNKYFAQLLLPADAEYLRRQIAKIVDPRLTWPDSDVTAHEYVFKCSHRAIKGTENFPLFRFHYTDFPGGNLTYPGPDDELNVQKSIEAAHTVIFLDLRGIEWVNLWANADKRIKSFCGACRRRNSVGLTRV